MQSPQAIEDGVHLLVLLLGCVELFQQLPFELLFLLLVHVIKVQFGCLLLKGHVQGLPLLLGFRLFRPSRVELSFDLLQLLLLALFVLLLFPHLLLLLVLRLDQRLKLTLKRSLPLFYLLDLGFDLSELLLVSFDADLENLLLFSQLFVGGPVLLDGGHLPFG